MATNLTSSNRLFPPLGSPRFIIAKFNPFSKAIGHEIGPTADSVPGPSTGTKTAVQDAVNAGAGAAGPPKPKTEKERMNTLIL